MKINEIEKNWDLIVIGGGIPGAGIFREAVRNGLRVILVEQKDFAWGTSSRSSKLVHGGLRYLKEGRILLTWASVHERERLLKEASGLVKPLEFLMPVYSDQSPGKWMLEAGLSLYDLFAQENHHKYFDTNDFFEMVPEIKKKNLLGGFQFLDAQVDDARLVQCEINEAVANGAVAMNYTKVTDIKRNSRDLVSGVTVVDTETHDEIELSTHAVINATGSWVEKLHISPDPKRHIRPLRGSHLIFPSKILPVNQAISFVHPTDNRPIFVLPWEGAVLVGTTDIDHKSDLSLEPFMTKEEMKYLMKGLQVFFPELNISSKDCISSFAGVRPVLSKGKRDPSKESRDHVVWEKNGLVTVTGGKLTTFRKVAWDAIKAIKPYLPVPELYGESEPVFLPAPDIPDEDFGISVWEWKRLYGRYGEKAKELVSDAVNKDLTPIPGTHTLWAEIPFAAKYEQVRHLSDLLLRRVRIGLLVPEGAKVYLDRIQQLCEGVLPWDKQRWEEEKSLYMNLWQNAYRVPDLPSA